MKSPIPTEEDPELSIAPLIDMVFLLLIYFMVTASLVKSEGDLGIRLPGVVQQAVSVEMPDEQIIEILSDDRVLLNGKSFGSTGQSEMPGLVNTLSRYKLASAASGNKALVTISAEDKTRHQRVIDVLNACAAAGVKNVTFGSSAE